MRLITSPIKTTLFTGITLASLGLATPLIQAQSPMTPLEENDLHPLVINALEVEGKEKEIEAWFKANHEGFDPTGPIEQAWIWYAARQTRPPKGKTTQHISTKYFNIGLENFNACLKIKAALKAKGLPEPYINAWLKHYAHQLIEMRMPLNIEQELKNINAIPAGEWVNFNNADEARTQLTKRYADLINDPKAVSALAMINATLDNAGFMRIPDGLKRAPLSDSIEVFHDGLIHVYRFTHLPSGLYLPEASWLKTEAEKQAGPNPIYTTQALPAELSTVRVALKKAGPEGEDFIVSLNLKGDKIVNGYLTQPGINNIQTPIVPLVVPKTKLIGDARWFTKNNAIISGAAAVVISDYPKTKRSATVYFKMELNAGLTGYTGTYTYWNKADKRAKRHRTASGIVEPYLTEMKTTALPVDESWKQFLGANGTGEAMADPNTQLVTDLKTAQLAWVSDATLPTGRGPDTRGKPRATDDGTPLMGAWASPVVADNKVVIYYYEPSGNAFSFDANPNEKTTVFGDPLYRRNKILATDIVHCFDATTGKTLWKRELVDQGVNWAGFNKGGPMLSPAIHQGNVYAMTTTGVVYCMDLHTGDMIWKNDIGPRHDLIMAEIPMLINEKQNYNSRNDFQINLIVADGVVIAGDGRFSKREYRYEVNNGLVAFDAKTGRKLWNIQGVSGSNRFLQSAQLIKIDGKDFIVSSSYTGVRLIEPRTGRIIDHAEDLTLSHTNLAIGPGLVVGDQLLEGRPAQKILAYKVTATGFEKRWTLEEPYGRMQGGGTYHDGRFYLQLQKPESMILCVDANTGKVISQVKAKLAHGEHSPFIINTNGRIIACSDRTNGLYIFDADPQKLPSSTRYFPLDLATGYCGAITPAIVDGRMYLRQTNRLVCYDIRASE